MSCISPLKPKLKQYIILSLLESEKKLSELKKEAQTRETTILHVLKELEKLELTTKSNGAYKLTPLGKIEAQINKMCCIASRVLNKYKDFWLTHDTSVIPMALIMNLGAIENSCLVKSKDIDLHNVHENFIELLLSSKTIFGISPIFHMDYVMAFKEILEQGNKVELIVTSAVLEKIKHEANELINKHLSKGNLQLYLNDNLKLALTVTEKSWSLGLFNLSGEYDYSNDLICNGEEGLEWGHQLYKEVLKKSAKI